MTPALAHGAIQQVCELNGRQLVGRIDNDDCRDRQALTVAFDPVRFAKDEARYCNSLQLNETTLAPHGLQEDASLVQLCLTTSTYARYKAAAAQFAELPLETRVMELGAGVQWQFSHSLGVNVSLETSDGKLIFTRRPSEVAGGKLLALAMNEGANVHDLAEGSWVPTATAMRGFREEMNLRASDFDTAGTQWVVFHSIIQQLDTAAISVIGHARTKLKASEVVAVHRDAVDGWEADGLVVVQKSFNGLGFLGSGGPESWTSWVSPAIHWLATQLAGTTPLKSAK